jgi:hypothetical protein
MVKDDREVPETIKTGRPRVEERRRAPLPTSRVQRLQDDLSRRRARTCSSKDSLAASSRAGLSRNLPVNEGLVLLGPSES